MTKPKVGDLVKLKDNPRLIGKLVMVQAIGNIIYYYVDINSTRYARYSFDNGPPPIEVIFTI